MNGKAIKKPVEIDWLKWDGNSDILQWWVDLFDDELYQHFEIDLLDETDEIKVKTLEGTSYEVPQGYMIIRGVQGEYYPIDSKIFEKTYNITT